MSEYVSSCPATHESNNGSPWPWYCTLPYEHEGNHKAGGGWGYDQQFFYEWEEEK